MLVCLRRSRDFAPIVFCVQLSVRDVKNNATSLLGQAVNDLSAFALFIHI